MPRTKVLFVAEAVTLAHVGRPLALANALDDSRYDIHFACAKGFEFCFKRSGFRLSEIDSISSDQFLAALAAGNPVYDVRTLSRYVEQDLSLLESVRPDVVVGDFRLSLSVSARLAKVPYIAISNAYWSPFVGQHYTVPALPVSRILPVAIADSLFRLVRPAAFALHAMPLNQVRRRYGLPTLGWDLRKVYTDADITAYADVPELFPTHDLPPNHSYLGPVIWSPPVDKPQWWDAMPEGKPIVYVTLGSSGHGRLLPLVLEAMESLPVTVIAANAGKVATRSTPANAYVADYLPGDEAARRASLVICNGGSPTSHQALSAGVPVIGIAANLDQFLNMAAIQRSGAGLRMRADRFNSADLRSKVLALLGDRRSADAARAVATVFANYPAGRRFEELLHDLPNSIVSKG